MYNLTHVTTFLHFKILYTILSHHKWASLISDSAVLIGSVSLFECVTAYLFGPRNPEIPPCTYEKSKYEKSCQMYPFVCVSRKLPCRSTFFSSQLCHHQVTTYGTVLNVYMTLCHSFQLNNNF